MRNDKRSSRHRSSAYMLCLEALEDRCLLSGNIIQTNLVSDVPGMASVLDPNLVNPWGISASPTGPFWIADHNAGLSTAYSTLGTPQPSVVSILATGGTTGNTVSPTGAVFNIARANFGFVITDGTHAAPASFLFATAAGTIAAWNAGVDPTGMFNGRYGASAYAVIAVDNSGQPGHAAGAVYKGLAIATDANNRTLLYAANFASGGIDVFDTSFQAVASLPAGAFSDTKIPSGYAPFNVQAIGDQIYVTYARRDYRAGPGYGFIDVFNLDGGSGRRLVSSGPLDLPWGLAIAPAGFGRFAGDLLVGNFGNGLINAFDLESGNFLGALTDPSGEAIQIDGLWALQVGNGHRGGDANTLYFTAGIDHEQHGLFGSLAAGSAGPAAVPGPENPVTSTEQPNPSDHSSAATGAGASESTGVVSGPMEAHVLSGASADPGSGAHGRWSYAESSTGSTSGYSYSTSSTYDEATAYPASQDGTAEVNPHQLAPEAMAPAPVVETPVAPAPQTAVQSISASAPAPLSARTVGGASAYVGVGHPATPRTLAAAHDAASSLEGALVGQEALQIALDYLGKDVEKFSGSPGLFEEPIYAAPQLGNLLAGYLTIDLAQIGGAVDRFFARLDELADNMSPETQKLIHWLLAGATVTGMFELVRRRTRLPVDLVHGDPDDSLWVPYPVLEVVSKRGQGL